MFRGAIVGETFEYERMGGLDKCLETRHALFAMLPMPGEELVQRQDVERGHFYVMEVEPKSSPRSLMDLVQDTELGGTRRLGAKGSGEIRQVSPKSEGSR